MLVEEIAMWFHSLFDALTARSSRTPARPKQRARRTLPLLEILEDRTLLSTYTVNALTDTGAGSALTGDLRYCVTNATSGSDTITFAPGLTGTINLQSALPTLNANVNIQGPGAQVITVDGSSSKDYGFTVDSAANVQIAGLTMIHNVTDIKDGSATISNCAFDRTALSTDNGATNNTPVALTVSNCTGDAYIIDNYNTGADLTVSNCTISSDIYSVGLATISYSTLSSGIINNSGSETISYSTISGGGVSDSAISNSGNLTINNSTISGNKVVGQSAYETIGISTGGVYPAGNGTGGGIYMTGGTLTINSSTIADNKAIGGSTAGVGPFGGYAGNGLGGGLYIAGGTVSINNSTFADNQAIGGAGPLTVPGIGYGGGIYNAAGPSALQMHDTILADDTADSGSDLNGSVASQGYNLIGNTTGGSGFVASDLLNVNPLLGPLQNNGGPTQTMALLPGSPAINAGDNTNAPTYDQRGPGFARIVNGIIDIGAFEVQSSSSTQASSLAVAGLPSVIVAGSAGSFTVTALNSDGTTDTNYTGTVHFSSSDPLAVLPVNYTFTAADAGVHTFSAALKTAGTQSITATDATTGSDSGITVKPAAASQLAFGQQPSTTTAGQTISPAVTVNVEDPYGNLVTSDSSTVTLTLGSDTFSGGSATASATASGGMATFGTLTIDRAGSYTLKATDDSLTLANSGSFTIQPAAASMLSVSGFPSPTTAGVAHTFTVTLKDAYGNTATGYTGTVHFTSSDHKATLPANYTFIAADAGVHTFTATMKTAGTQSITATDTATISLIGTDGGITVKPAAASKLVLAAPASVSAGVPFSLTVTVEDAYGNVVGGYVGTIHFSSTDTRATLPRNYTFTASDNGVHTFTGLVLRRRGNQKITVTDTHNSSLTGNTNVDVL
jgi:hypothetical protein